jgi:hypothetical protein
MFRRNMTTRMSTNARAFAITTVMGRVSRVMIVSTRKALPRDVVKHANIERATPQPTAILSD